MGNTKKLKLSYTQSTEWRFKFNPKTVLNSTPLFYEQKSGRHVAHKRENT